MSLKQKFVSGIALAFAVGAFSTLATAQETTTTAPDDSMRNQEKFERRGGYGKGMRGGKHGGGDRMMMRSLEKLNLTDAQKAQVKTAFENHRTQNQPQMEEMRGLGMKKRDGVITADEQTRFTELKTQMKASKEQLHNSILAILTAEQRTQLDQMKEEMRQKKMERRENRQNQTAPTPQDN
jgi:Spy/CpxP family protein refolding chaperone